jgi:hypothetical protein
MNERIDRLEAELSAMRPRDLSPHLAGTIAAALCEPARRSWSDRILVFAVSAGALAACVIVSLLMIDLKHVPPEPVNVFTARDVNMPAHTYAFARASSAWGDDIN